MDTNNKSVAIVGGGLVGALQACYMAKRGYKVDLYESRKDIRKADVVRGRSINLALSTRGRQALAGVGIEEMVTNTGVPMYARMIHDVDGTRRSIPYGKGNQHIMSIDRRKLNEVLLDAAESYPNVTIHFDAKLKSCDFEKGECIFEREGKEFTSHSYLIIGCDGAYSAVRRQMMKNTRLNFSQDYIPHGYMELCIPATKEGEYAMETNYLHIWARNTFMMIGLPNECDKSFVLTLFMPFDIFESIKTEADLIAFFEDKFPDSIPLIGKESLVQTYFKSKPLPMVTVRCNPYNISDRAVIMGDAAHAMVPFYGQGMNCGLEDCIVFNDMMDKYNDDLAKVLPAYSEFRQPDAVSMCDLALYNYIEMRASVNSRMFLLRKKVDDFLNFLMPNTWIPLYTTVSFSRTRYHQCIANKAWQDRVISNLIKYVTIAGSTGAVYFTVKYIKNNPDIWESRILGPIISQIRKIHP